MKYILILLALFIGPFACLFQPEYNIQHRNIETVAICENKDFNDSLYTEYEKRYNGINNYIKKVNIELDGVWVDSLSDIIAKTSFEFPEERLPLILAIFHTESHFYNSFEPNNKGAVGVGQLTHWVDREYEDFLRSADSTYKERDRTNLEDNVWLSFWYIDHIKNKYTNGRIETIIYYNGGNLQKLNYRKKKPLHEETADYLNKVMKRIPEYI